jgi:hypothetical protein
VPCACCTVSSEQCDGRSSQLHNPIKACLADDGLIVCGVCWVDALVGVYLLACVRASLLYQHACSCLPRSLLWAACVSMCEHVCPLCRLLRARPVQRRTGARDSVDSFVVGGGACCMLVHKQAARPEAAVPAAVWKAAWRL